MIALAHVETARAGDEFDVAVVNLALGGDGAATVARLLQRHTILAAFRYVKKSAPVRPEQLLVGGKNEEIGIEATHIGLHHADAVGRIDQQGRPAGAQRCSDVIDIDYLAVRPVHG